MTELRAIVCLCTNLKMADRVVSRAYDSALAPAGVNATQYTILVNIERYEPIAQMRLADHLRLERTSLYRAIDLLEKKRWVRSTPGEGVTRLLSLTKAGRDVARRSKPLWQRVHSKFVTAFGAERWDEFLGTLHEIQAHFDGEKGSER